MALPDDLVSTVLTYKSLQPDREIAQIHPNRHEDMIVHSPSQAFQEFQKALDELPDGYSEGHFDGGRWGTTVKRSSTGNRVSLYAEQLGGKDVVSFNFYRLSSGEEKLKPCEMAAAKVVRFVLEYQRHP